MKESFILLNFSKKKLIGFTLIELLVVISIIGLLSSIVIVSLAGVRTKARDTRIISEMAQLRSVAEMYLSNSNYSYSGLCNYTDVTNIRNDICAQKGQPAGCGYPHWNCQVGTNNTTYCIEVQLNSTKWWCVDSAFRSKEYASDPACPQSSAANVGCE